jgi:hypothetical protein
VNKVYETDVYSTNSQVYSKTIIKTTSYKSQTKTNAILLKLPAKTRNKHPCHHKLAALHLAHALTIAGKHGEAPVLILGITDYKEIVLVALRPVAPVLKRTLWSIGILWTSPIAVLERVLNLLPQILGSVGGVFSIRIKTEVEADSAVGPR